MNPYEKTAEEMKRQSEGPKRFAKGVIGAGAALGASAFAPILARAAPFLSQYIPTDLAIKGLSKISPKFGKFVKNAMDQGYDFEEIKDFVGEQINESQPEPAKENRNIIEQYSPELHQFLTGEIQKGRKPVEAGVMAQYDERFANVIKKLMKDHKTSWSNIIQSIYGTGETAQSGTIPTQSGATQQQMTPGEQAIAEALKEISQLGIL